MKLKFCGSTISVTGSCLLIEDENQRILVDCGMYQEKEMQINNTLPFPFDPCSINFLILTHAHLDHCGLIPKLYNLGFNGNVYCSYQTMELCKIILYDSAKIQEMNFRKNNFESKNFIYNSIDVDYAMAKFKPIQTELDIYINNKYHITLLPVGHILGACSVLFSNNEKTLLFSGDIGRINQSIIKSFTEYDFSKITPDFIVMETLYGGRNHENKDIGIKKIVETINQIKIKNSKLIIPIFALHRAQEILELLNFLFISKNISNSKCMIFFDSPMGIDVTKVYLNNISQFNSYATFLNRKVNYVFENDKITDDEQFIINQNKRFSPLNYIQVVKNSKSKKLINSKNSIILAASGMADGGRIIKHLYSGLEDPNNYIVFVGYQAEDTLGRKLVDGEKFVTILDKRINVRAKILYLRGFSAHGDNDDLNIWMNKFNLTKLKKTFLVHGEVITKQAFSKQLDLHGISNYIPQKNEEVML